jgi:bifunctional non-homologous end joining protein LigD
VGTRRYGRLTVETSREEKVFFPDTGLTKGDLVDYYEAVAGAMLPHLRGRPLVVERFPDGLRGEGFYQKQVPDHFPDWIHTTRVRTAAGHQELVVCDNLATLVYLADQACLTFHPWLSRADRPDRPDQLVVDLDPPGDDFETARRAAFRLRDLLDELELPAWPKLTGSKGIHVVVPLDRSEDFDAVRGFAREAMAVLAARHPDSLTMEQRKNKREGRLFLDVGRNAWAQTAVAPYAVRPLPGAPVATPVDWEELGARDLDSRSYTVRNVLRRLGQRDDPWAGMRRHARSLRTARGRLERMGGGG